MISEYVTKPRCFPFSMSSATFSGANAVFLRLFGAPALFFKTLLFRFFTCFLCLAFGFFFLGLFGLFADLFFAFIYLRDRLNVLNSFSKDSRRWLSCSASACRISCERISRRERTNRSSSSRRQDRNSRSIS